mgnify:CR=1 FL=1
MLNKNKLRKILIRTLPPLSVFFFELGSPLGTVFTFVSITMWTMEGLKVKNNDIVYAQVGLGVAVVTSIIIKRIFSIEN